MHAVLRQHNSTSIDERLDRPRRLLGRLKKGQALATSQSIVRDVALDISIILDRNRDTVEHAQGFTTSPARSRLAGRLESESFPTAVGRNPRSAIGRVAVAIAAGIGEEGRDNVEGRQGAGAVEGVVVG